jgi:hypothetical protein
MKQQSRLEKIKWRSVLAKMPDADVTVLLCVPDAEAEPVWPGHWEDNDDGGRWMYDNGSPVRKTVTHWAEMPRGPRG